MPKKVIIASQNPVKINAVKAAFKMVFPSDRFEFKGVSVSSGVKDQPDSSRETKTGAMNRANNAKEEYKDACLWVGVEGGIEKIGDDMESFAWVYIISDNLSGKARTGTFFLPRKIAKLIDAGEEFGEAVDSLFGLVNSKQENGAVGILTGNLMDRTSYYRDAVILALIPFKNTDIY